MNMTITCYKELGEITIWDKKFNSVGNKYTNKVISTKHVSAEKLKSLENTGDIKLLSTGLFDGYTDCADTSIINDLEVITIPSGGTANIKYYNGKFIDSGNLLAVSSNPKLYNLKYIYYYLQKHISLIEWAFRGASIKHPQMEDILSIKIPVCDITTQNQIVSILSELDNKIEQQNQIIDKFKKIKQSFLELLFPQNTDIPQLRFNSFTDTWEQRKLSDISKKISEKNTKSEISETFTNSAEYGIISQRDFFDRNITNAENINTYYIVRNEDFVYNPRISTSAPCGPINRNRLNRTGVMSPLYTVFRTKNIDTLYLEWFFKTPHWYPYMYLNGDTGARSDRFSIKDETFFNMPIPFPNDEEQKKIGTFLETLDNLITLHQHKPFHLNFSL